MDLLAHAVYGATVCSRTGLAGGRIGTCRKMKHHWATDWTVWCGLIMGLLPDVIALGPPWVAYLLNGREGSYWLSIGEDDLARYRYTHSLMLSLGGAGLIRLIWKPLFAPALAWPLHVAMDALTHGTGRFQTPIFYPLSTWGLDSIRWWEHPGLMLAYWLALPMMWVSLWVWRRPPDKHVAG
jgi:hypothetical protein